MLGILVCIAAAAVGSGTAQDFERQLKSKKVEESLDAVQKLGRQGGKESAQLLQEALKDKDWEVMERAIVGLSRCGDQESFDSLASLALNGPVHRIRRAAAETLRALQAESVVEGFAKEARGRKLPLQAVEALAILAPVGGTATRKALEKALTSPADLMRRAAATGLLAFDQAVRVEWLAKLQKDSDYAVYAAALGHVARYPHPAYLEELLGDFGEPRLKDVIERRVIAAVREIFAAAMEGDGQGEPTAVLREKVETAKAGRSAEKQRYARLVGVLAEDPTLRQKEGKRLLVPELAQEMLLPFAADSDAKVRATACWSLGLLRSPEALQRAGELAASDRDARVRSIAFRAALGGWTVKHPRGLELAVDRLANDEDIEVRQDAAVALGLRGTSGALEPLTQALADADWRVVAGAAVSLGKLGDPKCIPALRQLLDHKDWRVRGSGLVGLGVLQHKEAVPDLIEAVGSKPVALSSTAHRFLSRMSPKEVKPQRSAWKKWWKQNGDNYDFPDLDELVANRDKYGYGGPTRAIYDKLDTMVFQSRGDHIELLLEELEIDFRPTRSGTVEEIGVHPLGVFVSNCSGETSGSDLEYVEWFLHTGGYLFCSCWAMTHTAAKVLPGRVQQLHTKSQVLDHVLAEPCPVESRFLKGVFDGVTRPKYVLEGAHLIEVLDPERVEVLIDSPECATRWGEGNLAAWFTAGHGLVLDSANHFDLQGFHRVEGLKRPDERRAYAVDHLGLTYQELREFDRRKIWGNATKTAETVRDLSAFRFLTNFVAHKRLKALE